MPLATDMMTLSQVNMKALDYLLMRIPRNDVGVVPYKVSSAARGVRADIPFGQNRPYNPARRHVIANQSADWCGNLTSNLQHPTSILISGARMADDSAGDEREEWHLVQGLDIPASVPAEVTSDTISEWLFVMRRGIYFAMTANHHYYKK